MLRRALLAATGAAMLSSAASAQTEITFWQGGYEDTLTATIAAFRAGEQPNIVQVFDAGAATIIGAEGPLPRRI